MIPIETLSAFTLATVLLALAPGPDNLFVLTQSAVNGGRTGLFVVLGLCSGLIVHTAAVALGVAAIFQTSAAAFNALKIVGACYLVYLAWRAFKASSSALEAGRETALSGFALYRRGVIMNITNPKVAMFFLALFPQFTDPTRGSIALQVCILGLVFMAATFVVFGMIAVLAGKLNNWLTRSPNAQGILNKVAGVVFLALAAKLVASER